MYICPLCHASLTLHHKQYQCTARHSFDLAKEGYVNLLPVQQKNSKDPGDNKDMMQARRQFLEAGSYQPLSDAVNQLIAELAPQCLLDLGCGEGYYSGRLATSLPAAQLYGIDISKTAIKYAAKKYPTIHFAVASAYQLPFEADYFDLVLRIYAPSEPEQLKRVIKDNGHLVTVTPAPQHLVEMKQAVYQQVKLHTETVESIAGFNHLNRQRLSFSLHFDQPEQLANLIQMVPLAWKFTAELKTQFLAQNPAISLDFFIDLYQRSAAIAATTD